MDEVWPKLAMVVATALTASALQYFGATAPAQQTSANNRDANWSARDSLAACNKRLDHLMEIE